MGYYSRRYRRHSQRYTDWRSIHQSKLQKVSRLYGGIDDDVRQLFFALNQSKLKQIFTRYESDHGSRKREYAERTFQKWKSGEVQMGGEISERLIQIVPLFLTFDQKYVLIEKLWNRFRQKTTLNVTISPAIGLEGAIEAVMDAIDALGDQEIPTTVVDRLDWLSSNDSVVAQALLEQVTKRESEIAVQTLEKELQQLLAIAHVHKDKTVVGKRTVNLAATTVHVHVNQTTSSNARKPDMSTENKPSPSENPEGTAPTRNLAPLQNPNDLLGEALKRMSPQKQEEIIGKATDEALRLQVKQKEGLLDHEMVANKVENISDAAKRFEHAGAEYVIKGDHRSEHGSLEVTVRNKKQPLQCFVATACYGFDSHPSVVTLRAFRDICLRNRTYGRAFIAWYYRNSPPFAQWIEDKDALRLLGRIALLPIVLAARVAIWLKA